MPKIVLKDVTKHWGNFYAVDHLDLVIDDCSCNDGKVGRVVIEPRRETDFAFGIARDHIGIQIVKKYHQFI